MAFLASLTNQLGIMLSSQSTARRIMLALVALTSLGGLGWLIIHAQSGGGYVTLLSNLRPADGVEALAKLQQIGIKAKLENGGTTILAPQSRFDDAIMMLSMEGIPSTGTVGYEMMDKSSLGQSKFQQEKNYLRMREGELARTLLSIREIERAKVHLALPEDSLFVTEEKPATASVALKLQRGARLSERQVSGVVNLVSHSVEGLKPENVSVIDEMGMQLNQPRNDDASQSTQAQQTYKLQYEDLQKSRVESMLENVIGRGKVSARVQAEFNFATQHQIRQTYNPDEQPAILRTEKQTAENETGKDRNGIQGAPGSASNLPLGAGNGTTSATATAGPGGTTRTDRTAEYAVSSTWEETQQATPTPKRLSVAVLVDWAEDKDASGKSTWRPRTPEELTSLEDLVKAAIGYTQNETREDQVKVICERFKTDAGDTTKESFLSSYNGRQMIQLGVQWGIVGLIGLLLILMVLRPAVRQITVTAVGGGLQALPAGAAGAAGALEGPGGEGGAVEGGGAPDALSQIPASMLASLPPDVQAALRASQGGKGGALSGPANDGFDDIDISEIPEELRDNQEAIRQFKLQRLAAKQARLTQVEAQRIHQEVMDTAKNNPQKTVSLLRQWMDEA